MSSPFQQVSGFDVAHRSNIIWRYMSLEKFLVFLETATLRFSQASTMTDNRELWLPYEKLESRYFQNLSSLSKEEKRLETGWERLEEEKQKVTELRQRTYISSWSIAQNESYALWKIYLGGSRAGVAIKSTFASLQKSITENCKHRISCAKINYTDDPDPNHLEDVHYIFQKSTHYDYEKELRLTIDHRPTEIENDDFVSARLLRHIENVPPSSLHVDVDLNELIKEIYLSPFVIGGFRESFESIVRKIQPKLRSVVKSSAVRDS